MHFPATSVVAATPHDNLSYVLQAPLVTHPALFVVHVDNAALQDASVTRVVGNKEQLMGMQLFY